MTCCDGPGNAGLTLPALLRIKRSQEVDTDRERQPYQLALSGIARSIALN